MLAKTVDTSKDDSDVRREYPVNRFLKALIITLPVQPSKKWIGLGAIDIFHKVAEEKLLNRTTNFQEDIGSLLKNPIFADCLVVAGSQASAQR